MRTVQLLSRTNTYLIFFWLLISLSGNALLIESSGQRVSFMDEIVFSETETTHNQLNLSATGNETIVEFRINGTTGNASTGYVSQELNFKPVRAVLTIGNVSKHSANPLRDDTQVTISFLVSGDDGKSCNVNFVVGPHNIDGWFKGDLYERLEPWSSNMLNLQGLTSNDGYTIKRISIIAQSQSVIEEMDFGLRFAY